MRLGRGRDRASELEPAECCTNQSSLTLHISGPQGGLCLLSLASFSWGAGVGGSQPDFKKQRKL